MQLAKDVLLNSNGMLHMAHRMVARLGASLGVVAAVERGYLGFENCLPMAERMAGGRDQSQHADVRGQ